MPSFDFPFGIALDLSFWEWFVAQVPAEQVRVIFVLVGWAALALIFFYMGALLWVEYRQEVKYVRHWEWVLLAVEIPPLVIQTPKAVEQIFAHLSGAGITPTIGEKYWQGKKQKWFSFEIVSIEGYIQFLVRTEKEFRDLVEAAIYAQYVEAEITEVEDYTPDIPRFYPNPEYDVMGIEFRLAATDAFPIRTYPSFEYNISKDAVFSDPMAALLENFSRLGRGEQLWLQLIIEPTDSHWKEPGIVLVKKMMGQAGHGHDGVGNKLLAIPQALLQEIHHMWYWNWEEAEGHKAEGGASDVNRLSPGTKATVEAIEEKIAKIGFKSKLRVFYVARQEVYKPSRCLDGVVGAMNQFHIQDRNALVPYSKTHAHYDPRGRKTNRRKTKFAIRYHKRKIKAGVTPYILNIEELATVWHFPLPFVKTPLLSRAGAKRGEPPSELPVETTETPLRRRLSLVTQVAAPLSAPGPATEPTPLPPAELPYG